MLFYQRAACVRWLFFLLLSAKKSSNTYNYNIIKHLDNNIYNGARHLLASLRELKVRKLVVTRDTERRAL